MRIVSIDCDVLVRKHADETQQKSPRKSLRVSPSNARQRWALVSMKIERSLNSRAEVTMSDAKGSKEHSGWIPYAIEIEAGLDEGHVVTLFGP